MNIPIFQQAGSTQQTHYKNTYQCLWEKEIYTQRNTIHITITKSE